MSQLLETDIAWARKRVPINFPLHVLHGKGPSSRKTIAKTAAPGVYVFSYPLLSSKDADEILWRISPDAILCDEAHYIKDRSSARTQRLMRFVDEKKPRGVGLSGTITSKSVMDYWHLARWILGTRCPLPLSSSMAAEWAAVLDSTAPSSYEEKNAIEDQGPAGTGPLTPLVDWARRVDPSTPFPATRAGFRRAYRLRLEACPGVVASGENELGISLVFANEPVADYEKSDNWKQLASLMSQIENSWLTPNGDEIEHAIHMYKWLYELSAGFYNQLVWPTPAEYAARKQVSEDEAEDILMRARVHHAAGQEYAKELRSFLTEHSRERLDTPMLVALDMARHQDQNVPSNLYMLWSEMRMLDFEGRPDRDSHAVRICPYKIEHAVKWALSLPKGKGGIVWVHHQEIGRWCYEALVEAGVDAMHCPAGQNDGIRDAANAHRIAVASTRGHGTGKNLQHYEHQHVLQWPRPADMAEQMIGRTHRNGQTADEIVVSTNNTLPFDEANFAACLNDALYIHQTMGTRQKLIVGAYNPLPKVFPPEVLIERGFKNQKLDRNTFRILQEKFAAG
jgi:hypothetical protein